MFLGKPYGPSADVFSFAVIMYELFTTTSLLASVGVLGGERE